MKMEEKLYDYMDWAEIDITFGESLPALITQIRQITK